VVECVCLVPALVLRKGKPRHPHVPVKYGSRGSRGYVIPPGSGCKGLLLFLQVPEHVVDGQGGNLHRAERERVVLVPCPAAEWALVPPCMVMDQAAPVSEYAVLYHFQLVTLDDGAMAAAVWARRVFRAQ